MTGQPKDSQTPALNFPMSGDKTAHGTNTEGPEIHPTGHEAPPRMPVEHRQNSPHHASLGKKNQGKK